jgi:hypothetical protein
VLNVKAETLHADNLFYVFVRLNGLNHAPDYYIVPSGEIAAHCRKSHKAWLATLGRNGRKHKDTSMRNFVDTTGLHLGRWERLGLGPITR